MAKWSTETPGVLKWFRISEGVCILAACVLSLVGLVCRCDWCRGPLGLPGLSPEPSVAPSRCPLRRGRCRSSCCLSGRWHQKPWQAQPRGVLLGEHAAPATPGLQAPGGRVGLVPLLLRFGKDVARGVQMCAPEMPDSHPLVDRASGGNIIRNAWDVPRTSGGCAWYLGFRTKGVWWLFAASGPWRLWWEREKTDLTCLS